MEESDTLEEIEEIPSEEEDTKIDTSSYKIISYGADYTLSVLYDKLKRKEIITPEFQRKYVWTNSQASKLVESFLLGLPVPEIFLAKDEMSGNFLVVDGQQRLKTVEAFRDERFPLTGDSFYLVDVKEKWIGKKYSDLEPVDRKRFDDSILRTKIFQQMDPQDQTSVYHVFERLNTGGTSLQNQEIRNCIYYGKFNTLLHNLNLDPTWRKLYNMQLPNKRMKDEELILRFLALYYNLNNYRKPMNEFLSNFMSSKRNLSDEEEKEMSVLFLNTVKFTYDSLGIAAFRPKRNLNIAAFDSIMYTIAKYKSRLKANLQNALIELFKNPAYEKAITEGTTDEESIKMRLALAKRFLLENEQ